MLLMAIGNHCRWKSLLLEIRSCRWELQASAACADAWLSCHGRSRTFQEGTWPFAAHKLRFGWHSGPDSYGLSLPHAGGVLGTLLSSFLWCPQGLWQRRSSPGAGGAGHQALNVGETPPVAPSSMHRIFYPRKLDPMGLSLEAAQSPSAGTPQAFLPVYGTFSPKCHSCPHGWWQQDGDRGTVQVPPSPCAPSQPRGVGSGRRGPHVSV